MKRPYRGEPESGRDVLATAVNRKVHGSSPCSGATCANSNQPPSAVLASTRSRRYRRGRGECSEGRSDMVAGSSRVASRQPVGAVLILVVVIILTLIALTAITAACS